MGAACATAPLSDIDPFSAEFFEDPFPAHRELRDLGPLVRLRRYQVWASARYREVHAILNDWQTFISSRGVGLSDFAKEEPWRPRSLVLEVDPPLHDRTRRVLSRVLSAAAWIAAPNPPGAKASRCICLCIQPMTGSASANAVAKNAFFGPNALNAMLP